jgi:hypothetical protein
MADQEFSGTSEISLLKKTGQVTYDILEGYKYFHLFLELNLRFFYCCVRALLLSYNKEHVQT